MMGTCYNKTKNSSMQSQCVQLECSNHATRIFN